MSRIRIALIGSFLFTAATLVVALWFVHTRQGHLSYGRAEGEILQPDSPQSWKVALEQEEYAAVEVRPEGAEISMRLVDPSGKERRTLSGGGSGPLVLQWTADPHGRWSIEVDPGKGSRPVRYSIELTALRTATAQDRLVWKAESLDERLQEVLPDSEGQSDRALDLLPRVIALREKLLQDDPLVLASYINDLAVKLADGCAATPERWRAAEAMLARALKLREGEGPNALPEVAETLANLALVASYQGHWDRAERFQRRTLVLDLKHLPPKNVGLGYDLTGLAAILFEQGRYSEVESILSHALKIFQDAEPREAYSIVDIYNRLGDLHRALGSYTDAEESFEQAYRQARDSLPEKDLFFADLANNLAGVHKDLGEHHQAELLLRRALEICEDSSDCCPRRLATARLNLAEILRIQGDHDKARPLYAKALALALSALSEDDPELAWFLNQQGLFFKEQKEYEQAALFYEEARAVTERAFGPEHPMMAMSLQDLANVHTTEGDFSKAEALYLRALTIRRSRLGKRHPEVGETLTRLGELSARTGRIRLSEAYLDEAIGIFGETKAFPEVEAEAWAARANVAKSQGDLEGALSALRRSLEIVERLRPLVGGGERTRARFLLRYQDFYERMIEWEIEAGDLDRAFEYAERVRARVLVDQLFAARVDLRAGISPEVRSSLEKREAGARVRHAELDKRIADLERGRENTGADVPELLAGLLRERDEARSQLDEIEDEIRNASPLWKAIAAGEPVRLSEAQAELIAPGELILLYQIGPESGHLFLLPPTPAQASVEPLIVPSSLAPSLGVSPGPLNRDRLLRILQGPAPPQSAPSKRAGLLEALGQHPARSAPRRPDFFVALHALKQVLLPGDTWARVRASSRAVVIPEGMLLRLPFEALVLGPGEPGSVHFWLDQGPPLRYAASATALRKLADRSRLREPVPARGPLLLSVASPRFSPPEGKTAPSEPMGEALPRPLYPAGDASLLRESLSPLPGTVKEAERVAAVFRSGGGAFILQGTEASEVNVRAELKGKRYLHFATHAMIDELRGGMFAALALTPPAQISTTEDDGFLRLLEIYGLDLSCDLVVLSACQTRVGPGIEGEGVFALSRGFLVAGADRVVASLWRVDDNSTAELMSDFFQRIARAGGRGRRPAYAEALQQARQRIRMQARWSDPYYWAPFVLEGKDDQ